MRIHWVRASWYASLCGLLACVIVLQWEQYRVLQHASVAYPVIVAKVEVEQVVTSWVSGGSMHTVTTSRQEGESNSHWLTRHFKEVAAEQQIYPPDP